MKNLFLSLIAILNVAVGFAQTSLVATLSHNGSISAFYGMTALKDALAKAQNGDAISLSAGQFQATNITKAITLRGAGMSIRNDSTGSHESTIIQGDVILNIPDSVSERIVIEGIYFSSSLSYSGTIRNALFMKSRFGKINYNSGASSLVNSSFIHCRIANEFHTSSNSNACLINSIVWGPYGPGFEFDNCIVGFRSTGPQNVEKTYFKNCILFSSYSSTSPQLSSSVVALNCVGYCSIGSNNLFKDSQNTTNTKIDNPSSLLKSGGFSYNDSEQFELTNEAQRNHLGADGKQVGIYGGNFPYDENPTTPQITRFNVATKSTADGRLSVDIEVKTADY